MNVCGVASFITIDGQVVVVAVIKTEAAVFLMQTVVPEGFPFSQLNFNNNVKTFKM